MGSLKRRILKLEESRTGAEWEGLSAPQRHYRRAFVRATPAERAALERLIEDPGDEQELARLWEKVLRREAPTLADDILVHRDLLHRELGALEKELLEQGCAYGTAEERRKLSAVGTAKVNRRTAIIQRLTPLMEEREEARGIIEKVIAPTTSLDELLVLIGFRG